MISQITDILGEKGKLWVWKKKLIHYFKSVLINELETFFSIYTICNTYCNLLSRVVTPICCRVRDWLLQTKSQLFVKSSLLSYGYE